MARIEFFAYQCGACRVISETFRKGEVTAGKAKRILGDKGWIFRSAGMCLNAGPEIVRCDSCMEKVRRGEP